MILQTLVETVKQVREAQAPKPFKVVGIDGKELSFMTADDALAYVKSNKGKWKFFHDGAKFGTFDSEENIHEGEKPSEK